MKGETKNKHQSGLRPWRKGFVEQISFKCRVYFNVEYILAG